MRRGREFIGLMVYRDGEEAAPVGTVEDLAFHSDGTVAALIVVWSKGLFRRAQAIPLEAFARIGPEGAHLGPGFAADGLKDRLGEDGAPPIWRLFTQGERLSGTRLFTEAGEELGVVGDVILDPDPLRIWGFEVSDGLVKDLVDGRPIVEASGARWDGRGVVLPEEGGGAHMNLGREDHAMPEGSE